MGNLVEVLAKAGPDQETVVTITGEHGFVDINTTSAPNAWLTHNGFYGAEKGTWKAQFHALGAVAFLILKNPNDQKILAQVRGLLAAAPAAHQKLFRVVDRSELD